MKRIIVLLLLTLFSCKTEKKAAPEIVDGVDVTVREMWNNYIQSYPEFKNNTIPDAWFFHNNEKDANRLANLTVSGKKRASSGLYYWYEEANADLPTVGTKHIITDFYGKAQAIIEITNVYTIPFNQISEKYAKWDMGTEIDALTKWRKAHWDFFEDAMKKSGKTPTEEILVVCERFEKIWPK